MTYIPKGADPDFVFEERGPEYPEFEEMVARCTVHLPEDQREFIIEKVYPYANYWHQNQKPRNNGLPYISHPVEVASILAPYKLDVSSMSAALLHDVHEDNEEQVSLDDIERGFGTDIRNLVDGLTKIGKATAKSRHEAEAQAVLTEVSSELSAAMYASLGLFAGAAVDIVKPISPEELKERAKQAKIDDKAASLTKLVNEMTRDLRVIIVKLADRIHNMRTLGDMRLDKRIRISKETLSFFAPLATRLGMWPFKTELEDLCFKYIDGQNYERLGIELDDIRSKRADSLTATMDMLEEALAKENIEAEVSLQAKHRYSVLNKMRSQRKTLEQIFDLDPIMVVVRDKDVCYQALRIIHQRFGFLQGRFRDYIANPKGNNYQALHTTINGVNRQPLEVQICTREEEAENLYGVLNVFVSGRYQISDLQENFNSSFRPLIPWLASLSHVKEESEGDQDFIDVLCKEELAADISCYTPEGRRIELPRGSKPLDFAFKIHSELGLKCCGAIVNDREVSLTDYELGRDDIVQLITDDESRPSRSWYAKCYTRYAKNRISRWFLKNESPEPNQSIGFKLVCTELIRQGAAGTQNNSEIMSALARSLGCRSTEELYRAVGSFKVSIANFAKVLGRYRESYPQKFSMLNAAPKLLDEVSLSVRIDAIPDAQVFVCRHCNPVFGDMIKAVKGGKDKVCFIHRLSCRRLQEAEADRVYAAEWISGVNPKLFMLKSCLSIKALVRYGLSQDIIATFDNREILIYNYRFDNDYVRNVTVIKIEVGAESLDTLDSLMEQLKTVDGVVTVDRL